MNAAYERDHLRIVEGSQSGWVSSVCGTVLAFFIAAPLSAAEYDLAEYLELSNRAAQNGVVRVLVGLDVNGSLDAIRQNRAAVKKEKWGRSPISFQGLK